MSAHQAHYGDWMPEDGSCSSSDPPTDPPLVTLSCGAPTGAINPGSISRPGPTVDTTTAGVILEGSSHECMHGSGQWQVRHAVIEVADVIRCCPEAIGFMNEVPHTNVCTGLSQWQVTPCSDRGCACNSLLSGTITLWFLTQMCARFSPSRSAAPWEEGADALVPANQRCSRLSLSRRPPARAPLLVEGLLGGSRSHRKVLRR